LRNLNTFREGWRRPRWASKWLLAVFASVCFAESAGALGPNKLISQYLRDQWDTQQGFPGGPVYAFAQTPDGYLWIGTEKGLVRFDGISFHLYQGADSIMFPAGPVLGLAVDGDGSLWVRLQGARLLRYRDGVFQDAFFELKVAERNVTAMCVGRNGEMLFSGLESGILRYSKGKFETLASRTELPGLVISLAETADGNVWIGTRDAGLFSFAGRRLSPAVQGLPDKKINSLIAIDRSDLWIGTDNGVARWNGSEFSEVGGPHALKHSQALVMTRDRDANLWVGTSTGLLRIDPRNGISWDRGENRPADAVTALFEDREGNLWVGAAEGIERLREGIFTTYSLSGGLPSESIGPIYADAEGQTWFAPPEGGLYWLKEGKVGRVTSDGLDRDVVYSITGGKGELWLGRQRGGLTHLRREGGSFVAKTYSEADGLAQNHVYSVYQSRDGAVWAGTLSGGLSRFKNGSFRTFTIMNGLASNSISSILEGSDGTMWIGTPNGLSAFSKGEWWNFTSGEGLPPGNVNCLLEDSSRALWIGTANGLAFLSGGKLQTPSEVPESLHGSILGIEEDRTGSLWIATANHILRLDREKLLRDPSSGADVREYGIADGLLSTQVVKRSKSVITDSLGRIWFATNGGLSFVDPRPMSYASAPALVHVEGISADGRTFPLAERLRIPAPHQRITLSYAGLSLSVPSRVRFRYKLEGFDREWSEPTPAREASYTNLDSGNYRFRVMASNSDGLWNGAESALQFEIQPVFWQTWWFLLSAVFVLGLLLLALIRLRLLQVTKQLNLRFEERLAERTRIAQELHDTLLQGVLSASMHLHVADEQLPADSPAKPFVARVLELMSGVVEEGRNVVHGLRASRRNFPELEQAFLHTREEFPMQYQTGFRVIVEGAPRPLRPLIRDEVYLIGHEALCNAFRHSRATDIEVELEYAASHLRVFVRDNGAGIDPQVLSSGRDGHWGLSGMKERTERIGGRLRVLSRPATGTEVELSVPSRVAFEFRTDARGAGWLFRLFRGKEESGRSREKVS